MEGLLEPVALQFESEREGLLVLSQKDVAVQMGMNKGTISRYLKRADQEGILKVV